jgi:hypothetical protein
VNVRTVRQLGDARQGYSVGASAIYQDTLKSEGGARIKEYTTQASKLCSNRAVFKISAS